MKTIRPVLTYADLSQFPEDGKRYEILEGVLAVSPSPSRKHQLIVWNLVNYFTRVKTALYGQAYVAPFDVVLDSYNVVQPDIFFIRTDRLAIVTETHVQGAPDLIVEVLSPTTRGRDLGAKAHLYAQFAVSEYWVIDPDSETLTVYSLTDTGYCIEEPLSKPAVVTCSLFPTIPLILADLFI